MAMAKRITLQGSRGADLAIVFGVSVFDDAKLNLVLESDSEPNNQLAHERLRGRLRGYLRGLLRGLRDGFAMTSR